mmetsp:Transcript_16224/g.20573  ORF Transcript_16224/g.20573 Transcript_16224/m.20573 type:complete len:149 (-) Transcript_16224:1538-1984(-)
MLFDFFRREKEDGPADIFFFLKLRLPSLNLAEESLEGEHSLVFHQFFLEILRTGRLRSHEALLSIYYFLFFHPVNLFYRLLYQVKEVFLLMSIFDALSFFIEHFNKALLVDLADDLSQESCSLRLWLVPIDEICVPVEHLLNFPNHAL